MRSKSSNILESTEKIVDGFITSLAKLGGSGVEQSASTPPDSGSPILHSTPKRYGTPTSRPSLGSQEATLADLLDLDVNDDDVSVHLVFKRGPRSTLKGPSRSRPGTKKGPVTRERSN